MNISFRFLISFSCILIVLFVWSSCANLKAKETTNWFLELNKGGCLDGCKSYTIQIDNMGIYFYKGVYNVKQTGQKTGILRGEELEKVDKLISEIDWFSLKETYGSPSEDSQQNQIIYKTGNIQRKVTYYRLEPQEIRNLEDYINKLIDSNEF